MWWSRRAIVLAITTYGVGSSAPLAIAQRPLPPDQVGVTDRSHRPNLSDSADAVHVLQGMDTVLFFAPHRVAVVGRALHEIRRQYPEVESIAPSGWTFLLLDVLDSVVDRTLFIAATAAAGGRLPSYPGDSTDYMPVTLHATGLPGLDALNARLGVDSVVMDPLDDSVAEVKLYFSRSANIPAIQPLYDSLRIGLSEARSGLDGDWIQLVPKGRVLHFVFSAGGGDCPNGCLGRASYHFSYDTATDRVSWDDSLDQSVFRQDKVHLWDVPHVGLFQPYGTFADVFEAMRSNRWWVREHAVWAMGFLLDRRSWLCRGVPPTMPTRACRGNPDALREAATAQRQKALKALIDRLGDRDTDVARAADGALQRATGHTIPWDRHAQRAWRQWVAHMSSAH